MQNNQLIASNLAIINKKITNTCQKYQKNSQNINLIAVSKTVSAQNIIEAINNGCQIFGENYIKEAQEKWPQIKQQFPQVKLHFIGKLQSNKANSAIELFDSIQSLDSEKLALVIKKELDKFNSKNHRTLNPQIFIQVNIGQEPQKSGIMPDKLPDFVKFVRNCNLNLVGLMCIPPSNENPAPYFALLTKMARENNLQNISMGMSADYEEAIALGANYIRVGSSIFGARS